MKTLFICFLCCAALVNAQPPEGFVAMKNPVAFKAKIAETAEKTNTIHTDFVQEKTVSILSNTMKSSGEMYFKKPQMLKWAYSEPYAYVIVLDGKDIVVSDAGKVSSFDISSSEVFRQINDLIVNSVRGDVLDEERFEIGYLENASNYLVQLVSKEQSMREHVSEIWVHFDKSEHMVSQIRMNEAGGDFTVITFQNRTLNQPIGDEIFRMR